MGWGRESQHYREGWRQGKGERVREGEREERGGEEIVNISDCFAMLTVP